MPSSGIIRISSAVRVVAIQGSLARVRSKTVRAAVRDRGVPGRLKMVG